MTEALSAPGVSLSSDRLIALRRVALAAGPALSLAALPGGFATRRKGHGLEVADMREYVSGDDIRHLDRGTTARTGRLHIRTFQEERDRVTLLVADFRPAMFWGLRRAFRSVAAAEALSMIGWHVVETGGRVALLALTPEKALILPPKGRARGMLDAIGGMVRAHDQALKYLMNGDGAEDAPLDAALARAERLVPAGAELVIASGFDVEGQGLSDRFAALRRHRSLRLLLVTDAEASALPRGRYPIRLQDGRFARVALNEGAETQSSWRDVAGERALVLDAGGSVDEMARMLSARDDRRAA